MSFQEKFQARKPLILAFAAGLLVGPLISGMLGWQVRMATVDTMVRHAAVLQQVKFCEMRARAAVADASTLDYTERYKLAEQWAKLPWQGQADSEVVSGCSNGLIEPS